MIELLLIALDRNHIISTGGLNLANRFRLTMNGIRCHHGSFQLQQAEQFLNRGNLVRFRIDTDLAETDFQLAGAGIDDVQSWSIFAAVVRSTQRSTIDADDLFLQDEINLLNPLHHTVVELGGVEASEYSAECVMRRNTVRQFQRLLEPHLLSTIKPFNVRSGIGTAD